MDEILFRVWIKEHKKMQDVQSMTMVSNGYGKQWKIDTFHYKNLAFHEVELMQYTGANELVSPYDKIFKGDLIKNCDTGDLQVVCWNNDKCAWYCKYIESDRIVSLSDSLGNLNYKVGNIYDNHNDIS